MKLAITGKGGVGKTTLASTLAWGNAASFWEKSMLSSAPAASVWCMPVAR